ncbi:MAG TPA: valine--tRNA ligase [Candidatus Dormibacteraeota bacterium]|nr:valine--tRNA ligase [Candidatus Dormibacteraeota bacterium]
MNQDSPTPTPSGSGVASLTSSVDLDSSSKPHEATESQPEASPTRPTQEAKGRQTPRFRPTIEEKRWDHLTEIRTQQLWEQAHLYRFKINSKKSFFIIDTPPPYPSGRPWHIGALAHYSQIDMIARSARMMGHETFFPIGIDRNGLPVERYVETTYKIDMRSQDRKKFIDYCAHALDDLEEEMLGLMKRAGLSPEFENKYRTDGDAYRKLTQSTFITLWKKGLIYEATYPSNYCPGCQTTIADAEIIYEEKQTKLVRVAFKVRETGHELVIATTRPELMSSCQLVIVNPEEEAYNGLQGLHAIIPIFEREVEIRAHPSAKREKGTGAVMVCSYGDYTDVAIFRELGLREIISIDERGRMTSAAGPFRDLTVEAARAKVIEELQTRGLVRQIESIRHQVPTCERSKTTIEIIPMKEYYLKQLDSLPKLTRLTKTLKFHPQAHRSILLDWLNSIKIDWPISRRRYYGTEIPIWYCKKCGAANLPKPGNYYRPWRDPPPFKRCSKCGNGEFSGETRILDTWMDSGVTPLYNARYGLNEQFYKKTYPATIRPQGKDIVRTWLHYTLLRCTQLTGRPPFDHVWIMGMGMDEKGERMSKSRGNVVDPKPVFDKYGADAFRLWAALEVNLGADFRYSEARVAGARNTLTKLWNLARFISSFPQPKTAKLRPSDLWILSELSELVRKSLEGYRQFNFFIPATEVRDFLWGSFASHYLEMAKTRAYGEGIAKRDQKAAWSTLHTCLRTMLMLLAPIAPHVSDTLWRHLYGKKSVHIEEFPKAQWARKYARYTKPLTEFNSGIWKAKKEKGLSLSSPIESEIPSSLELFASDLRAMHRIPS